MAVLSVPNSLDSGMKLVPRHQVLVKDDSDMYFHSSNSNRQFPARLLRVAPPPPFPQPCPPQR